MTTLLHLDSSSRTEGSHSREIAATFRATWQQEHPDGRVVYRDLAADPLPHLVEAVRAAGVAPEARTPAQVAAVALQTAVVDDFSAADEYLVSLPMYNWSIPSQLKSYLDHLLQVGRTMPVDGSPSPLAGRHVTVVVSFGGGYGAGSPKEGWDFVRPYLTKVFAEALGMELEVVAVELTLSPVVPAMAALVPLHEQSRTAALQHADSAARPRLQSLAS